MDINHSVEAGPLLDSITTLASDATSATLIIFGFVALVVCIGVYIGSKGNWMKTFGALCLAALMLWGLNGGMKWISDRGGEEIESTVPTAQRVEPPWSPGHSTRI
ncbi:MULTISPECIES: hypothetical protein [Micrococcaceae]|uniref:hypothetical protein n=1 Tax=Micrococcaceae TaxID=1268 RepID=UPI000BB90148|nr:hypothetical protein [Glutamicibacter sp. BW78]PCC26389.1 hypothetical protein CIK75_03395 [Glutamicibacter sp. BW78]